MKTIKKASLLFASLALVLGAGLVGNSDTKEVKAEEVITTDTITADKLKATDTKYMSFSEVTINSSAVYAGNNAKNNVGAIQLRSSSSNSGIVSTASGGTLKSISIVVSSGTNTLDIYGANSAYSSASDLYKSATQGKKLGSLSSTGTFNFPEDITYQFIGLRSNSGALYLSSIEISWSNVSLDDPSVVIKAINDIGDVSYSDACLAKITAAREVYDSLSEEAKKNVTNYNTLTAAETKYGIFKAIALINAIGEVSYSDDCLAKITAAKEAYESLSEEAKKDVTNYQALKDSISQYEHLKSINIKLSAIVSGKVNDTFSKKSSANYIEKNDYCGIYSGNYIYSKLIFNSTVRESNIEYSIDFATYGNVSANKQTIYIGAYSNNVLVSNQNEHVASKNKETITGNITLNNDALSFELRIIASSSSTGSQFVRLYDASFSYTNSESIENFVSDWAKLRAKGGEDGICHFLTNDTRAELDAMLKRYSKFTGEDKIAIDNTADGGTTIANTIEYVSALLSKLDNNTSTGASGVVITSNNSYDKTSLITLFAILGIVTISAYYIIEKKKFSK